MKDMDTQNRNYVYLDGSQPLVFEHSLIIQTTNKLVIIDFDNDTIISRNGTILQVYNYGRYFVIKDNNNLCGVIRYDGFIVVPFEFYAIFLCYDSINVKKDENSKFEIYGNLE